MNFEQYRPAGFRLLPPVVKNILIISGLFYLATLGLRSAFHIDLVDLLGMHYFAAEKFKPYQIVTYMFMHGSFQHILFNMFAFWMFGYVLENVWGSKRFLIYFLITGMGAAFIQMVVFFFQVNPVLEAINLYKIHPSPEAFKSFVESSNFQVISIEIQNHISAFKENYNQIIAQSDTLSYIAQVASVKSHALASQAHAFPALADSLNAQSQILNARSVAALHQSDSLQAINLQSTVNFINQYRVDYLNGPLVIGASGAVFGILLAFGMLFPNTRIYFYFLIPIKAKWFVIGYGAIELFLGFTNFQGDNVAHFAHLGGMLFGFILIKYWNKKNRQTFY